MTTVPEQRTVSLLLVGGSGTGKSHYGGQLLKRLNDVAGKLLMDGVAHNVVPYEEVLSCLAQGCSAGHTPSGSYQESIWPVRFRDATRERRAKLIWPDYAGEQVESMTKDRQVTPVWQARIRES